MKVLFLYFCTDIKKDIYNFGVLVSLNFPNISPADSPLHFRLYLEKQGAWAETK